MRLVTLNVSECKLDKKGTFDLFNALNTSTILPSTLLNLNVSKNKIDKEGSKQLSLFIKNSTVLRDLDISGTNASCRAISSELDGTNKSLRVINVSYLKDQAEHINDLVAKFPAIREVDISHTSPHVDLIIDLLQRCSSIKAFTCTDNDMNEEQWTVLCHLLSSKLVQTFLYLILDTS